MREDYASLEVAHYKFPLRFMKGGAISTTPMATRANIELCDKYSFDGEIKWNANVMLYHHYDGYPAWMGPELDRILKQVKVALDTAGYPYWWDSERVGALMIKLSADHLSSNGVPRFQPCRALHGDIDYLWRVQLSAPGQYEIECFRIQLDWETDRIGLRQPIDWRKELVQESQP